MLLLSWAQELLDKCHPLGMFDSIATLAVASNMRELYRLVLVDTPLAPYFSESLSAGGHVGFEGNQGLQGSLKQQHGKEKRYMQLMR